LRRLTQIHSSLVGGLSLIAALVAAGCASATVSHEKVTPAVGPAPPARIVVYPFATTPAEVTLNQNIVQQAYRELSGANVSEEQARVADQAATDICMEIVSILRQKGSNAVCRKRGSRPGPGSVLIVDGEFTEVNQGDSATRLVIGLGVGAAVVNTNVRVYQMPGNNTQYQILSFKTEAHSGSVLGVALSGPVGLTGGATSSSSALTKELGDKTAHQIADALFRYFVAQGWRISG
jgi:hypothetical protein